MVECVDKNGFRCIRHSRGRKVIVINSDIIPNNLFVLKHKDLAMGLVLRIIIGCSLWETSFTGKN